MYGMTPMGSFSGILHLIAKRPKISAFVATVALAGVITASLPAAPTTNTIPPAPSIETLAAVGRPIATSPCQVEVPEPHEVRQVGNCYFNYSAPPYPVLGAKVDSNCKHKLDETLAYLKTNKGVIVLEGNSLTGHGSIAMNRAWNVRKYLISNGIDPQRIHVRRGVKHTRVVDLILET